MYTRRQARHIPNGPVVIRWTTGTSSERKPPAQRTTDLCRMFGGKRKSKTSAPLPLSLQVRANPNVKREVRRKLRELEQIINPAPVLKPVGLRFGRITLCVQIG